MGLRDFAQDGALVASTASRFGRRGRPAQKEAVMFRAVALVLSIAALGVPSGYAAHEPAGMRSPQVGAASHESLCDRLKAELGPKGVPFRSWSHC